jgi:uncharacterized membrane protein YfhO
VDGRKQPVLRANIVFRAVQLPAGRHEVVLAYWPRSLSIGLLVSCMALLALALAWWTSNVRKQSQCNTARRETC